MGRTPEQSRILIDAYYKSEQDLIEGNIPTIFEVPPKVLPRHKVIFEIGKRAMRKITKTGK